jgi:pectin methylesterase-like acyl-CoA thioesterase
VSGNTATIQLHHNLLEYGRSYYVLIDPAGLTVAGGFKGITDKQFWRFMTKSKGPRPDAERITVSADGNGDFNTVQGAIDFVPDRGRKRITIVVRNGTYEGLSTTRTPLRWQSIRS